MNCNNHFSQKWGRQHEHPFKKIWKEKMQNAFNHPSANVRELDNKFELHLYAPGFVKSDFKIDLVDKALAISVASKEDTANNWKRQEYVLKGFERQFELNDKIDRTAITATYENGVLIVSLPKLEGQETERQEIKIV